MDEKLPSKILIDDADPLGGAYFIESLTNELEAGARKLIERVDEIGGAVEAIEQGFVQREIEDAAFRHNSAVESGEKVIVGVNSYREEQAEPIELHRLDPAAEKRQLERTAKVRAERNADEAARPWPRCAGWPRARGTSCRRCARRSVLGPRSARSATRCVTCSACTTRSEARPRIIPARIRKNIRLPRA